MSVLCINTAFFLLLGNIPLYGHTKFYLFVQQLVDIWVSLIMGSYPSFDRPFLGTMEEKQSLN